MLKISTKGRYGLKAAAELARRYDGGEGAAAVREIAERTGAPENYLEQLLALLKKAGITRSARGAKGGYLLAKPPSSITVGEVLRATEGSLAPVGCLDEQSGARDCGDCDDCVTREAWQKIFDGFNSVLDGITLDALTPDKSGKYRTDNKIRMEKKGNDMDRIYMDNAATTRPRPEALAAARDYWDAEYGNPSSIYAPARAAKKALDKARAQVAAAIGAQEREIYFTGGGTEADNWALMGVAEAYAAKGRHIITTAIEHHAVLRPAERLAKNGYDVTFLPVDEYGRVSAEAVANAIRPDTTLVSVMFANNEVGTIQPIAEIGKLCAERKVVFHTDAVQAAGHVPIDVNAMNIGLLSLSGHKFYGVKGVGALYIKSGLKIAPFLLGGSQERNRRAGTENVAGICALGAAIELATAEMPEESARLAVLRDRLIAGLLEIPNVKLNGHPTERLPGSVNVSFQYIEGESILLLLDMKGISASSGSACTSGSLDPSHVLLAMGLPHELAHGSVRLTLGRDNTAEDVERVLTELKPIIERLRAMSPLTK